MRRVIVLLCIVLSGLANNVNANPYSGKYYLKGYQDHRWCDKISDEGCLRQTYDYLAWRHLRANVEAYFPIIERFNIWLLSRVKEISLSEARDIYQSNPEISAIANSHGSNSFLIMTSRYFEVHNKWPKEDRFEYSYDYFEREANIRPYTIKVYRQMLSELWTSRHHSVVESARHDHE